MATMIRAFPRQQAHEAEPRELPVVVAPLLVATDASAPSDAAIRAAREIAARTRQPVRIVAVHAPVPVVSPEVQLANTPDMEAQACEDLADQVHDQIERVGGSAQWEVEVVTGDPAATIAGMASDMCASLVIMGLGGHGVFDRLLGDEMVLQVLRLGTVPVLAVAPAFSGLPLRVLAGIDFSASSVRALTLGAQLLRPRGKLTLAHVITQDADPLNWNGFDAGYSGAVGRAMDRVIAEVGFGDVATVERKVISGDPSKELLRLMEETTPDLVVAGSHGHNFLSRLLLGSVSTRLIRQANCSVLVAPPDDAPGFIDELPEERGRFAFYEWAERLEEFTRRNVGVSARLEVIDPEIGAQIAERGTPFVGASFDPRDARVHIMFGGGEGGGHLTRSIVGVTAIQMLRDRFGRDVLLRVAHGRGQTLLTLER
jgi:nucleotide-binding universal stress UspA family protein